MSNLDEPANAQSIHQGMDGGVIASFDFQGGQGFTKRERACIDLRIPESGDAELDALIEKALRREMAAKAMEGMIVNAGQNGYKNPSGPRITTDAVAVADEMLDHLSFTP